MLQLRLEFMKKEHNISENDFLTFDAIRQAAQCVGRVIRSKLDYGLMVFADNRYTRSDKRKKLPQWLSNYLKQEYINLSTDVAVDIASKFVKRMAQPHSRKDEIGKSLLSLEDIVKLKADIKRQYSTGEGDYDNVSGATFEQNQFAALNTSLSKAQMNRNKNSNRREQMDID